MQSTRKTAPKKTDDVSTHRNNAMDLLVFQITRNPEQVDAARLKRHVFGILRPTMEGRLKNFLSNPENNSFDLTVPSWKDLIKLNSLLEKSGLFKSVDLVYEEPNADGSYDARLDVEPKALTLGVAKKLLSPKEKKLFALMKKEAAPKAVSEFKKPAKLGTDPLANFSLDEEDRGGIEDLGKDTLFGDGSKAKTAPKKVENASREVAITIPFRHKSASGSGRSSKLFPKKDTHEEFQAYAGAGDEYSFKITAKSNSFKPTFLKAMEKAGIDRNKIRIKRTGNTVKVTLEPDYKKQVANRNYRG